MTTPESRLPVTAAALVGRSAQRGAGGSLADETLASVTAAMIAAEGLCAETIVVMPRPEAVGEMPRRESARVLAADSADAGALGELATALSAARHEWVLAVALDEPGLEPAIATALWAARDSADVVMLADDAGARPTPALYRVAMCLPAARATLATGRRRIEGMIGRLRTATVPRETPLVSESESHALGTAPAVRASTADARDPGGEPSARPPVTDGASSSGEHKTPPPIEVVSGRTRPMPSERPVTIFLNDVEIATTQATPRDLEELAAGFLISEGLLGDREALVSVDADPGRGLVYVKSDEIAPDDITQRARYLTSGCGGGVTFASVGHARGMKPVTSSMTIAAGELYGLVGEMARAAVMHGETGGVHACGLGRAGRLVSVREDVGRHNALDKLLGRAWLDGTPTNDAVLISTGRISYEMAVKAAKAAVPIVATRSAVTDLAADIGDELGITLVGYVRGRRLTVYTHPERVLAPEGE